MIRKSRVAGFNPRFWQMIVSTSLAANGLDFAVMTRFCGHEEIFANGLLAFNPVIPK
jgi:hypothetical protein